MADIALVEQIEQVRWLIADTGPDRLIEDGQLSAFLTLNGGAPLLAAAQALEVIAVSEVLVGKKIRTQDLSTDGPAVSAELRALAKTYRDQHAADRAAADQWDGFDVIDTQGVAAWPEGTARPVYVNGL